MTSAYFYFASFPQSERSKEADHASRDALEKNEIPGSYDLSAQSMNVVTMAICLVLRFSSPPAG